MHSTIEDAQLGCHHSIHPVCLDAPGSWPSSTNSGEGCCKGSYLACVCEEERVMVGCCDCSDMVQAQAVHDARVHHPVGMHHMPLLACGRLCEHYTHQLERRGPCNSMHECSWAW